MNPVPADIKPRVLTTAIDLDDSSASIDLAFANAEYFGLKPKDARKMAAGIAAIVSGWRKVADKAGLGRVEIDRMASAFEHEDLEKARIKAA
jgi:serine/threonine-protein kinase HipA